MDEPVLFYTNIHERTKINDVSNGPLEFHMNWNEAADLIINSMEKTIASKVVTYDFARLMDGATEVKCSEFADELIKNM